MLRLFPGDGSGSALCRGCRHQRLEENENMTGSMPYTRALRDLLGGL
jgi:hypothetical protein